MNMQNYYGKCWKKYGVFSGRACRREYWSFALVNLVISLALEIAQERLCLPGIAKIYELLIIVPSLSVTCRRLHDIDMSGWWQLLWTALPGILVLALLLCAFISPVLAMVGWIQIVLAMLLTIIAVMVRKGTDGENRFGPDPLAEEE